MPIRPRPGHFIAITSLSCNRALGVGAYLGSRTALWKRRPSVLPASTIATARLRRKVAEHRLMHDFRKIVISKRALNLAAECTARAPNPYFRNGSVATEAFGTSIASGQRWPESGHPRSILKCRDGGQLRTRRSSSNNLCRRSASRLTLSRQPRMIVSTATSPQDKRPRWLLKCLPDCDWQRGWTVSWTITGPVLRVAVSGMRSPISQRTASIL